MNRLFVCILLLLIIDYGLGRNITERKSRLQKLHKHTEEDKMSTTENKEKTSTIEINKLFTGTVIKEDCLNNTCCMNGKNKSACSTPPPAAATTQENFKPTKLMNDNEKPEIIEDMSYIRQAIKTNLAGVGNAVKVLKRSALKPDEDTNSKINIGHLLQTFIKSNKHTIKSVHFVFLIYVPDNATNEKLPDFEQTTPKTEPQRFTDFVKVIDARNVKAADLEEYLKTKVSEIISTSTFKPSFNENSVNENLKIFEQSPIKTMRDLIKEPDLKLKEELTRMEQEDMDNEGEIEGIDSDDDVSTETTTTKTTSTKSNKNTSNTKGSSAKSPSKVTTEKATTNKRTTKKK